MPLNPNEQKAYEVMTKTCNDTFHCKCVSCWEAVKRLSAAGLLVTPDHEAALAACEERAKHPHILYSDCLDEEWERCKAASLRCIEVGRRSLDAKKPKERWTVDRSASQHQWVVWHAEDGHSTARAWFALERDASAYAAEQNAKEAGR